MLIPRTCAEINGMGTAAVATCWFILWFHCTVFCVVVAYTFNVSKRISAILSAMAQMLARKALSRSRFPIRFDFYDNTDWVCNVIDFLGGFILF